MSEREVKRHGWSYEKETMAEFDGGPYVLATDFDAERQRRVEAEAILRQWITLEDDSDASGEFEWRYAFDANKEVARAHLARYKEDSHESA